MTDAEVTYSEDTTVYSLKGLEYLIPPVLRWIRNSRSVSVGMLFSASPRVT